jgi:hypothetical protein
LIPISQDEILKKEEREDGRKLGKKGKEKRKK